MRECRKVLGLLLALAVAAPAASREEARLYNPYARLKNGPPLTRIFHKVEPRWLLAKLQNPKLHPSARMPDLKLTEEEALDIMAYLKSVAGEPLPRAQWPAWGAKGTDELTDRERTAVFALVERGKAVWGKARCTICHTISGPRGRLVGGFVDLRVGGIDLMIAGTKLKRDWLYAWLTEPKSYFPDTLMPRYRFSDDEVRALVEYILRDTSFFPAEEEEKEKPERFATLERPERARRGKRLIEVSRCVVCHDIKDIPEVLSAPLRAAAPPAGSFEFLAYDLRCMSCHSIEGRGGTYAPDLTTAGSRLREDWIVKFVGSPDMIRPLSQQMPRFNLTANEAKLIASYLSKSRRNRRIPADIPGEPATPEKVQRGRDAFKSRGCFSCHSTGEGPGGTVGPQLATVGKRLRPGYIWFHLNEPHNSNPYSAEPDYGLSDEEARPIAVYLATRK